MRALHLSGTLAGDEGAQDAHVASIALDEELFYDVVVEYFGVTPVLLDADVLDARLHGIRAHRMGQATGVAMSKEVDARCRGRSTDRTSRSTPWSGGTRR